MILVNLWWHMVYFDEVYLVIFQILACVSLVN